MTNIIIICKKAHIDLAYKAFNMIKIFRVFHFLHSIQGLKNEKYGYNICVAQLKSIF